ncbi:MAG TPA: tRNA lysidine(34) synthetase TilS, partial [Phycisphaerales bacterium]|nr:tRNA lysidine(34) synthetase TilS [Phycisphaerales bacterium]
HPVVQRIVLDWRRLAMRELESPNTRTLIACSGGADSTALLLAIGAAAPGQIVVGHVAHDLRPEAETRADRDAVAALAAKLDVPFIERSVRVPPGNAESHARRLRYAALAEMARETASNIIATGHHADDQFESILMALIRGTGLDGLRGIAPRRRLKQENAGANGPALIRPMLGVTHAECEALCRDAGIEWRTDATNLSGDRLRSKLRIGPIAELIRARPGAAANASNAASILREASRLVRDRATEVFADAHEWPRDALRYQPSIILGTGLRRAFHNLTGGQGADRLGRKQLTPVIRAIKDRVTDPRIFEWPRAVRLTVAANQVTLQKIAP